MASPDPEVQKGPKTHQKAKSDSNIKTVKKYIYQNSIKAELSWKKSIRTERSTYRQREQW
jgi:hypothetical protein